MPSRILTHRQNGKTVFGHWPMIIRDSSFAWGVDTCHWFYFHSHTTSFSRMPCRRNNNCRNHCTYFTSIAIDIRSNTRMVTLIAIVCRFIEWHNKQFISLNEFIVANDVCATTPFSFHLLLRLLLEWAFVRFFGAITMPWLCVCELKSFYYLSNISRNSKRHKNKSLKDLHFGPCQIRGVHHNARNRCVIKISLQLLLWWAQCVQSPSFPVVHSFCLLLRAFMSTAESFCFHFCCSCCHCRCCCFIHSVFN